jgi:hypothetical protein
VTGVPEFQSFSMFVLRVPVVFFPGRLPAPKSGGGGSTLARGLGVGSEGPPLGLLGVLGTAAFPEKSRPLGVAFNVLDQAAPKPTAQAPRRRQAAEGRSQTGLAAPS